MIDNRTVITGSFNWSPSAAHQNDEVLLVIESPLLAAHFTREMDRLWRGAKLGITDQLSRKLAENRRRCGSGKARGRKGALRLGFRLLESEAGERSGGNSKPETGASNLCMSCINGKALLE